MNSDRIVSIVKGLTILAGLFGIHLAPEHSQAVVDVAGGAYVLFQLALDNKAR